MESGRMSASDPKRKFTNINNSGQIEIAATLATWVAFSVADSTLGIDQT